ncbi:MAG TPA: RNA 2',3'-cyclic phosphodiesterase [Thermomicrobiales bacterium]|nr:RNA 2',3'-cyclic phosphodiesterase [Thermomicrobiales bacterium]
MSETWRCFIAVPIAQSLRKDLATMVAALGDDPVMADFRWTDPAGWHLTVAFLGATPPSDVDRIAGLMRTVANATEAFTVRGGGLGAFPSARQARVVWYGLDDPRGRLRLLAQRMHAALGIEGSPRFRGHLTLARSRERFGGPNLAEWFSSADAPIADFRVDRLVLCRSHLGQGPARYEPLAEAHLVPAAAHV